MSKKFVTLVILIISVSIISIGCSKNDENIEKNISHKANPISKENALNVLRSEYGGMVVTTENDIKQDGENYIVDVYIEPTVDEEEHNESDEHDHKESIGVHKINIYTGELTKPDNND